MATTIKGTNPVGDDSDGPGPGRRAGPTELGRLWRRWLAVVELMARNGRARSRLDPDDYRALHRELMEACRALARAPDNPKKWLYEHMERLVSPWLSVGALEQADGEIIDDLLFLCRQLDRQLSGRRWGAVIRRGAAWAFLILIAAGSWLVVRRFEGPLSPLLGWVKGKWLEARWLITHSEGGWWLFAGAALVTLVAIYLVSRTGRG
jgi:hypothetical protein